MNSTQICEHGAEQGWWWKLVSGGWNGPLSTCECCGTQFGYIDGGAYNGDGTSWGRSWTKDRCGKCGGRYIEWGNGQTPQNRS